jgi:hypothetical protein
MRIDPSEVVIVDRINPDEVEIVQAPTNTIGQEAKRQGGLFLRQALSAAGSVGAIPADAIGKAVNYVAGREVVPNQQQAFQNTLTRMGLPEPERAIEKFGQGFAESAPAVALPAGIVPQVLGNAAMGAAQAPAGSEGSGAAWGAGGGAAGHVLSRAMGGIVRPTAEALTLMDRGVALTPGQAAGAGSGIKRFEDTASSWPIAGHAIRGAQRRAVEDANVAAAQVVARQVDQEIKLGRPPREAIERTRDAISGAYDNALEGMSASKAELSEYLKTAFNGNPSHPDIPSILKDPNIPPAAKKDLANYMTMKYQQAPDMLNGQWLKEMDSEVGYRARQLASSPDPLQRAGATGWQSIQTHLRNLMEGAAAPNKRGQLTRANQAYRELLALEKSMLPGADTFTPRKLVATLEKMNSKKRLPNTDLGRFANAMSKTLPNTVPDSGTAERLLVTAMPAMLGLGGAGASNMGFDTLGAGMMAAGALGSRPGAKFMTGGYGLQQAIAEALRRGVPAAIAGSRQDDQPD